MIFSLRTLKLQKINNFSEFWVSNLHGNLEVGNLLIELSQKYEIRIITNMYPNVFDIMLEKGIVPKIEYPFIIKSCDIGFCKVDKEIYEYALQHVNRKGEILFTYNDLLNLEVPKCMSWKVVHFKKNDIHLSVNDIKNSLL